MVDRHKRDQAALILRDLIDAKITNDQFVRQFPKSADDLAIPAILQAVWMQFSDHRVHRLTGRDTLQLPSSQAVLHRCWLFLTTNLEFQWPKPETRIGKGLLRLVGFGGPFAASDEEYKSHGDFDVWPFLREERSRRYKRQFTTRTELRHSLPVSETTPFIRRWP